jgi:hypothetical protein
VNFSNQLAAVVGHPLLPPPPLPLSTTALPPPPPAISPPAAQALSHPLSVSESSNPAKKRKISGPMVPPASRIVCSTSSSLTASLFNTDALGTSMVQDVNLVSSNYLCFLYSLPDNMGVWCISNESDEVSPTTTNITKLMENDDVRLVRWRISLRSGTACHPVYIAPNISAFSSLNNLDAACISTYSCCGKPTILPVLLSTPCQGEPLVGPVPVSPIQTAYDPSYCIKLPHSFSHALRISISVQGSSP